jgi:predicted phosphoribosyltransferase
MYEPETRRDLLPFEDRADAGRRLAAALARHRDEPELLVLALPRGGVEVAYEIARSLRAELDVFIVRKLGVPGQEELAMGAIASGGGRVLNPLVIRSLGIRRNVLEAAVVQQSQELRRRERVYRDGRRPPEVRGRHVLLVDDGVATGATARAAIAAVRQGEPSHLTLAVPVAPRDVARELSTEVDRLVCLATPEPFGAVGRWYGEFEQTSDELVRTLLARARGLDGVPGPDDTGDELGATRGTRRAHG